LPEALSEALGVGLSEVLDLYFRESDKVKRGHMFGEALDGKRLGERDQEWLERESKRQEKVEVSSYQEDNTF
jgi:hypothetical protein